MTRWGSQQKIIRWILEQENAIRQVLGADRKTTHLIPTWQDTDVLDSLDKALSPLAEFTNIMSVEQYVSVSSLRPPLHHLKTEVLLEQEDESDTTLTADIKQRVLTSMQRRHENEDVSELIDKAGFLDPCFRLNYVAVDDVPHIKDCIAREATKIHEVLEIEKSGDNNSTQPDEQAPPDGPPAKKRKLGSLFKKKEIGDTQTLTAEQKAKEEIERYLQCPQAGTESDPLGWWKLQAPLCSALSKLARRFLCICATSAASESHFSVSGNVVNSKRN